MKKGMTFEQAMEAMKKNNWAVYRKDAYTRRDGVKVIEMAIIRKNFRITSIIFEDNKIVAMERVSASF